MLRPIPGPRWVRYFVRRSDRLRTTWTLRLGGSLLVALAVWSTAGWWSEALGRSLVCETPLAPSDAILIENFDPDYLLFERARILRRAGLAGRVLVPVPTDRGSWTPNDVSVGIAETLARLSRVGTIETVAFRDVEPITLNAVRDMEPFFRRERIRSLIIVSPLFRSRRSALVYGRVLGPTGITLHFSPVAGTTSVTSWTSRWHGMQDVAEQWAKLQYYRFYVMPFCSK